MYSSQHCLPDNCVLLIADCCKEAAAAAPKHAAASPTVSLHNTTFTQASFVHTCYRYNALGMRAC
jgi:hypothetical protein